VDEGIDSWQIRKTMAKRRTNRGDNMMRRFSMTLRHGYGKVLSFVGTILHMRLVAIAFLLFAGGGEIISVPVVLGRTIIVAADGSGEFTRIASGVDFAEPGDTVLVRPGDYWDERFTVDSAVVLMAERRGQTNIWLDPSISVIILSSDTELWGFTIIGSFMGIGQNMIVVIGDRVVINNCFLEADARHGSQIVIESQLVPPTIRYCRFDFDFGESNVFVWHRSLLDVAMPDNCYGDGFADTTVIHNYILDRAHGDSMAGYVYVTPVWEGFQWLAVDDRQGVATRQSIVHIYPNPSHGVINLNLDDSWYISQVIIYNILGQRVMEWDGSASRPNSQGILTFNLSRSLPSGTYIVEVIAPQRIRRMLFVLNR